MFPGELVLASNSPRRRQMLDWLGLTCRVQPADLEESPLAGELPVEHVCRLARAKAAAAARACQPGDLVLAADTTVADGQEILGKPAHSTDAAAMLFRLRGREHQVFTALTLLEAGSGRQTSALCQSPVHMRNYSDAEVHAYIDTGDPLDKAGAYGIQHAGFHAVENFAHCFANVMGLPLCHLQVLNTAMGGQSIPAGTLPAACRRHLGYVCAVHAAMQADAASQVRMA